MASEFDRRKQVIARRETDMERWKDTGQLEQAWNPRAQMAADFMPAGAVVLDMGCGQMALQKFLPASCSYLPCDVVARHERTRVCDFNKGEFPQREDATHISLLGVLEYIYDVAAFLKKLHAFERPVILTYNPADFTPHLDRAGLGWVNHMTVAELEQVLDQAGFGINVKLRIDSNQVLLRLSPTKPPDLKKRTVVVLSAMTVGNFGDRLGYHLINEVLPAQATIHHAQFDFGKGCRLVNLPQGNIDLLVLGIGNSLFGQMLTDELLQFLGRVPKVIGIFGTQYREVTDSKRMGAVIDRLSTWYARSEEDLLIYGKNRANAVHGGDWLASAFPLTRGTNPQVLTIGAEMWNNLPLDRTIQNIQSYRKVMSTRMHPLLCALASAEQVAYREQRENAPGLVAGKFRSLLIDVFGRTYPEDKFFDVDQDAVAAYKVKIQQNMAHMRRTLAAALA